jgi:hypothetical protein
MPYEYSERIRRFHDPDFTTHITDGEYLNIYVEEGADVDVYYLDGYSNWMSPFYYDRYYYPYYGPYWHHWAYFGFYDPWYCGYVNPWYYHYYWGWDPWFYVIRVFIMAMGIIPTTITTIRLNGRIIPITDTV